MSDPGPYDISGSAATPDPSPNYDSDGYNEHCGGYHDAHCGGCDCPPDGPGPCGHEKEAEKDEKSDPEKEKKARQERLDTILGMLYDHSINRARLEDEALKRLLDEYQVMTGKGKPAFMA